MAGKVTIIAYWEHEQMPSDLEWRMWRQLRGAFAVEPADMEFIFVPRLPKMDGYGFKQYDTIEEALTSHDMAHRVFLESTGYNTVHEIPQGDIALILGNTHNSNIHLSHVNETYAIATPGDTDLYGINAAAIALAARYGQ